MIEKFNLNGGVQIDLNLEDTVQNKNSVFYSLASYMCKTSDEQKMLKLFYDAATKHNLDFCDFILAIYDLMEEFK